jgi:hypothetical protein
MTAAASRVTDATGWGCVTDCEQAALSGDDAPPVGYDSHINRHRPMTTFTAPSIQKGVTPGSYYVPHWCSATTYQCAQYHLHRALDHYKATGSIFPR